MGLTVLRCVAVTRCHVLSRRLRAKERLMPKDRITTPQGRCRLASVVGIALLLIGCSGDRPGDGAAGSVPVVTPSSAYEPLDYDNAAQEATFAAYRRCAAQQGVQYEGPLQDSTGNGIFFKLAKGDQAS